jgi:hypothetical protein
MGNNNSQSNIDSNILDNVLTQETFKQLITVKCNRLQLQDIITNTNKVIKIYICDNSNSNDKYYVAHLKTVNLGPPSFGHIFWGYFVYHEYFVYGFDIYEYSKINEDYKKLYKKNYYICNIKTRNGYNMSHDFETILNVIKQMCYEKQKIEPEQKIEPKQKIEPRRSLRLMKKSETNAKK